MIIFLAQVHIYNMADTKACKRSAAVQILGNIKLSGIWTSAMSFCLGNNGPESTLSKVLFVWGPVLS